LETKTPEISYLPIAVRALTDRFAKKQTRQRKTPPTNRWPKTIIVFDTETTIDQTQRLNFGSYWWGIPETLETIDEGLFYGDDLRKRYPDGFTCLEQFVNRSTVSTITGKAVELKFRSRFDFVKNVFFQAAYKSRALVVGFNLPFDISRLAVNSGIARGRFYGGGFSFRLWDYKDEKGKWKEHLYRPRICVKHLDSKRSFIAFRRPSKVDPENADEFFPGYFLDLKTLGFALKRKPGSLAKMCKTFGVEHGKKKTEKHGQIDSAYIEYNLRDLLATYELYQKQRVDFDLHPIDLEPHRTFSPASIGKKYLLGINLVRPKGKFKNISPRRRAKIMSGYFGGRAECRFRGIVPVVYCDFRSMYPTVNSRLGLWPLLTADKIKVVDVTNEFRRFLATVTLEDCFAPDTWKKLNVFARVRPDADILPTRARYDETSDALNIGINELTSPRPLYYAAPDLVASALLTGKVPKIERAIRLVPIGKQAGLRSISIRRKISVDPVKQDFFRALVQERQQAKSAGLDSEEAFLKVLVNSISYGIFAEMNPLELSKSETILVNGLNVQFKHRTKKPEELGDFCFPPIAVLISSAARLMLAMLERCVADEGGHYASCDTDSMTIIATEAGGSIPVKTGDAKPYRTESIKALSWNAVDRIVERFEALNPYDRSVVPGSILKMETENFEDETRQRRRQLHGCFLASKRYALFNLEANGKVTIRKLSEHGLGHLRDPINPEDQSKKWIAEIWRLIILEESGLEAERPEWFARPAVSQLTISSPRLLKPFISGKNRQSPYIDRVKPFNFVVSAQVAPFGHPAGVNPKKCRLIAPYNPEARQWLKGRWHDVHSGKSFSASTTLPPSATLARVKSVGDVYDEYKIHVEAKSAGPDGNPCGPHTRGLLSRRRVYAAYVKLIGKEANKIEEVEHEQIHDWEEVQEEYFDPKEDPWFSFVVPILKLIKRDELAKIAGIGPRSIQGLRNDKDWKPSKETRIALTRAAADYARAQIGRNIRDDLCACAGFLNTRRLL
jgi:hypothetical protein